VHIATSGIGSRKKRKESREGLFEELQLVKEIWDNFHFFVPKIPEIAGAESNRYMYVFGKNISNMSQGYFVIIH